MKFAATVTFKMSSLAGKIECPTWPQENKLAKRIDTGSREVSFNRNQSNEQLSTTIYLHKREFEQQSFTESSKFEEDRLSTIAEQLDRDSNNNTDRFILNRLLDIGDTEWENDGIIFRGELPAAPNINDTTGGWYR